VDEGKCRDAAEIALLVTAPADDPDAAAFLTHAATCDRCGPLVEAAMQGSDDEAVRALVSQLDTAGADWQRRMARRFAAAQPQARRPSMRTWTGVLAGLAAAAALVVAVRVMRTTPGSRPELQELVAAVAGDASRPVDGRLTGGFAYGAPPTLLRGPSEPASPRVRIAEAKLDEAARAHDTPATQAALGVGLLAIGDVDKAIEALEDAVMETPGEARYQSDLSAAYIARAKWRDRAEDWPRALAAAERAIKADPLLVEPYFNRALALEGLHLDDEAVKAWTDFKTHEKSPQWLSEADAHLRKLRDRASAPVPPSNQDLRERIEDVLLAQWGEAVLAHDEAKAAALLDEAEREAARLVTAGGDAMARDEIASVRAAAQKREAWRVVAYANGHQLYGEARASYEAEHYTDAVDAMLKAAVHFKSVGSPYAQWGRVYRAVLLRVSAPRAAIEELSMLPMVPSGYANLRGRRDWTEGVALDAIERFDIGRQHLAAAIVEFDGAHELENLHAVQAILAEADWFLGNRNAAWIGQVATAAQVPWFRVTARRNYTWQLGAAFSLGQRLPEAALHFQDTLVHSLEGQQGQHVNARSDQAYIQRAQIYAALGETEAALADVSHAESAIARLTDAALRDHSTADLAALRAQLLEPRDRQQALAAETQAIEYVSKSDPAVRLVSLLALRSRTREALGDKSGADADLAAALNAFERKRSNLATAHDRSSAFGTEREVYREMIERVALVRGRPLDALRIVERANAGSLGQPIESVDPTTAISQIPAGVALIVYITARDHVLTWVLTADGIEFFSTDIGIRELDQTTARLTRRIAAGATVRDVRSVARPLVDGLIEPALRLARRRSSVFFVPDGPLFNVPFAALPRPGGDPLIASYAIGVTPNLSTFLSASRRLTHLGNNTVLAVGDGHDPSHVALPRLPLADAEAMQIARAYSAATVLVGAAATKRGFLASEHAVAHFAGHALINSEFPLMSRLLFANDDTDPEGASLFAFEVLERRFQSTRTVVLASCDGAAGRAIDGEGLVSLSTAFLRAGVPSIVASLWSVDEAVHPQLIRFHEELRRTGDPAGALRTAQLAFLRDRGVPPPIRLWAGFVAFGGIASGPHDQRSDRWAQ
jgi:CHAT domain-containing protein